MPAPFDLVRERLERQYLAVPFDPSSGLSREELSAALARHRAEHPDEPRILTRAWLFELICAHGRIAVDPEDPFVDKLEHHELLLTLREAWRREAEREEFGGEPGPIPGAWRSILDVGHTCPGWQDLLTLGLPGLRDRAAAREGVVAEAVTRVYDAAIGLVRRFAAAQPGAAVAALADRPPQTFHEALQLAYLYHELHELENGYTVRSMGRFDQLYHPFYAADLAAGRLTREGAKELLKHFWIRFYARSQGKQVGKPFLFGPEVNALTTLAFEVYRELAVVDPKLHVRLGRQTPQAFLDQVVECLQAGCTGILIANDEAHVELLQANGKTRADAEQFILIGCYEPAVMGRELNCSGASGVSLAKSVELVLAEGEPATFDALMAAYLAKLDELITGAVERTRRWERRWPEVNPSPFFSGTMASCVERGLDASQAGAEYNTTGCCCYGLANAVDSLAVIRQLVYEEQVCTLAELKAALAADWQGHEALRLRARHRVPKWGNNDDRVDALAVTITRFLSERINHEPNARGGVFQAALYTILGTDREMGRDTGALPDGRRAGEPLTLNTGASPGLDRHGVTALINSVTKLDLSGFPNGTVLDLMLHPSVARGPEGTATIGALIRSHFAQGGLCVQFNLFDAATLREAQRDPARYAHLQVRVCGWNVRFIDLAPAEQDLYLTKAEALV